MVRDGRQALISRKKSSIVMISPASRDFSPGRRPVYVVGMNNLGKAPAEFRVADVTVTQKSEGRVVGQLPVKTYEELAQEERTRQVVSAVIVGLAAGANAAAASQAGYGTAQSTVHSGGRTATVTTNYYSPTAAAVAQANAGAQNEAMIANTIEGGRQRMAVLEQSVIKDNTLLPGEWYGGQLHFEPPASGEGKPKAYTIEVRVGDDLHSIDVVQGQEPRA
jgi:hypothetical protein